jgi:hypothetical protein
MWFSVWLRAKTSRFSAGERLACCLATLLGSLAINAVFYGSRTTSAVGAVVLGTLSNLAMLPFTAFLLWLFQREDERVYAEVAAGLKRYTPAQQERLEEIFKDAEDQEWTKREEKEVGLALAGMAAEEQAACFGRQRCCNRPCVSTSGFLGYVLAAVVSVGSSFLVLVYAIKFDLDKEGGVLPPDNAEFSVSGSWFVASAVALLQSVLVTNLLYIVGHAAFALLAGAYCAKDAGDVARLAYTK